VLDNESSGVKISIGKQRSVSTSRTAPIGYRGCFALRGSSASAGTTGLEMMRSRSASKGTGGSVCSIRAALAGEQQVPPLRRRWRCCSGWHDRVSGG
jgi:hypothetical protein